MAEKKKDELTSPLLGVSENTAQKLAQYQAGYQQGENVTNAYNEYANIKQNAPQAYSSPYQAQLDNLYNQIVNRKPFQYDMNGDMLYQNAKEQYQQLGKQAMVDTMGQAAQLTGGYGNSYAQNVGNQAYQQYLLKLNEQLPTYYNLAMQRYNMEGDALNNQYGLLNDRENEAYGRYRDTVSDYNQNLQMAYNVYNNERDNDYGQYRDALGYWQDQAGAENKDYWTQTQFEYQKEQDALDRAFQEKQLQQEMSYKYAALAQQRALAAAKQKAAEEEEQNKSIMSKLGDSFKSVGNALVNALGIGGTQSGQQTTDTANTTNNDALKDIVNSRYVSSAAGLNNNGLGVALTAQDAAKAQNAQAASSNGSIFTKQNKASNVLANNNSDLKKFDLYGATTADKIIQQAELNRLERYTSNSAFLKDLVDTLEYYTNRGDIDEKTAEKVLKKYS